MIRIVIAKNQALVVDAIASLLGVEPGMAIVGRAVGGDIALALICDLAPDVLLIDVLLIDIEMSGCGIDVAARIADERLAARVAIVTILVRPGCLARARASVVRGYLLNDTSVEKLATTIRMIAAGGRLIAADLAAAAWEPVPIRSNA